jgi:hypothetical protein
MLMKRRNQESVGTGRRAHSDDNRSDIVTRGNDVALAFKHRSRFHDYTGRIDIPGYDAGWLDLNSSCCPERAVESTGYDDLITDNLTFDGGLFSKDQRLLRDEGALHFGINAEGSLGFQSSVNLYSLLKKASPFA